MGRSMTPATFLVPPPGIRKTPDAGALVEAATAIGVGDSANAASAVFTVLAMTSVLLRTPRNQTNRMLIDNPHPDRKRCRATGVRRARTLLRVACARNRCGRFVKDAFQNCICSPPNAR